jgi:hypothetical protein
MIEAMTRSRRKGSSSKGKGSLPTVDSHLNNLDLPDDSEDTTTIISEMSAQKAVFDAAFSSTPNRERVTACSESTLKLLPRYPEKLETKLLIFCLSYCIGEIRTDLIPETTHEVRWTRRAFEALSIGWMRWMADPKDNGVLFYIANMHNDCTKSEDDSFDTLILNFWAKAIELMVLDRANEAKMFFDRANEIGTQIGTSINPSVCWTYATSFYRVTCIR